VGGQSPASMARPGSGKFFQSIVSSHGEGGTYAPGFERTGWIQAFVLNQKVLIFTTWQHGSHAFAESHRFGVRQHGRVAPHAVWTGAHRCTRGAPANRRQIVADIDR